MARKLLKFRNLKVGDDGQVFMINFAGRCTDNNPNGHKQFNVIIEDEELAEKLKADGWNIFRTKESEKYGPSKPAICVEMRWHDKEELQYLNPIIYKCTSKKKTKLTEDLVPDLEKDEILNIDLNINPSYWKVNGKEGIKAYVEKMWVTIEDDDMEEKYGHYDNVDELPFGD